MASVVFNPATFKQAFPEFADVPDVRLSLLFNIAASGYIDNTGASIVIDLDQRQTLIWLLVAHMLSLFGTGQAGNGSGPSGVVGRLSSATEGSVSSSFAYGVQSPSADWYLQTQYGAAYWQMLAPYRSFRYVANGQSGIGRSLAYGNRRYPIGHERYVAPIGPIIPGVDGSYVDEAGNQYADELGTIYIGAV